MPDDVGYMRKNREGVYCGGETGMENEDCMGGVGEK